MSHDGQRKSGGEVEGAAGKEEPAQPQPAAGGLRRRDFLKKFGGGTLAAMTLPELLAGCGPTAAPEGSDLEAQLDELALGSRSFTTTVYRREDMVALTFTFINMSLDATGTLLERAFSRAGPLQAMVVVTHEPQHLLERAFIEDSINSDPPPPKGPVPTWVSGRSRVAYFVPAEVSSIPFTTEDLLAAASDYQLSVGLNATPPPAPPSGRRIGLGGLALGPLTTASAAFGSVENVPLLGSAGNGAGSTAAAALALTQTIRATRGLRALSLASGADLGFAQAAAVRPGPGTPSPTFPKKPTALQTSLEIPYRLQISPNSSGQWAHAVDPVTSPSPEKRTELWHSRLAVRGSDAKPFEGASYLRTIRALWTRDSQMDAHHPEYFDNAPYEDPFGPTETGPLRPRDRVRIVHQSSNFRLTTPNIKGRPITPTAVDVNRLMLTAMGGWMDVRGDWGDNPALGLALWENRATMARDHFVKIVETGYLYPFGHRAVLVTITERKFKTQHPHEGFLRKRTFLVVKQPTLDLSKGRTTAEVEKLLRKMPFQYITLKTLVTPPLDGSPDPKDPVPPPMPPPPSPFDHQVIRVGNVAFRFHCEALDPEGRLLKFTAPGIWVQGNARMPVPPMLFSTVHDIYLGTSSLYPTENYTAAERMCDLAGQRVAYAPSKKHDDTTYETKSINFTADMLTPSQASATGYQARFVPEIEQAELAVQAVRHLADAGATPAFSYHQNYVDHGFSGTANDTATGNAGELLFGLAAGASPIGVSFSKASDKAGGFLTPNMSVSGLSRKIGPVGGDAGDLAGIAGGKFDAKKFFAGLDAKLFGVIDLFSIIQDLVGDLEAAAPKFITQALDVVEGFIQDALAIQQDVKNALGAGAALVAAAEAAVGDISTDPTKLANLPADLAALNTALGALQSAPWPAAMNKGLVKDILRRAAQVQGVIAVLDPSNPAGPIALFLNAVEMAKDLRVKLEWRPPIQPFSLSGSSDSDLLDNPLFEVAGWKGKTGTTPQMNGKDGGLVLSAEVRAKAVAGKPAGVDLIASLENFTIYLIGKKSAFLTIPFEHIQFSILAGQKPDVDVKFGDFVFGGVLEFVKTLSELIPGNGFSDPPSIDVDETGIKAQFSLALPDITVGMLSITNISLGAGFKIPFIGDPLSVNFNFCTRENPFVLTVMMIGGGGFFGITLDPKGIKLLEAQFEAGAELALDFGVASGSVSIMVGIYFKMEGDNCTLTAFFKIHGEVEVLGGIISASLTLELDLTYESATKKLTGTASMEIEVHVIFFSIGVTVTCTRTLAGGNGDPSFVDAMRPSLPPDAVYAPWDEYVTAFAA